MNAFSRLGAAVAAVAFASAGLTALKRSASAGCAALAVVLLLTSGASAQEDPGPFITPDTIDLLQFWPPPPANDSEKAKIELAEVLSLQITRTPEMVARCESLGGSVWAFAELFGPWFTGEELPVFDAFFDRVGSNGDIFTPARTAMGRQRPFQFSELVMPIGRQSSSPGWPSGTATNSTLSAIVLSNMVPELRGEIMAIASEVGECRVIMGVHYRSSVELGATTGFMLAVAIMATDEFQPAFEAARDELLAATAR